MGAFSKLVLLAGAGQSEAVSFVGTTEQGHIDAAGWVDDAFGTTLNTTTTDDVSFLQAAERRQKSAFGKFWEGLGPEVEKNIPENKYKTVLYKKYDKSVAKADSTANRRAGDSMRQEARDMFDLTMQVVMMIKNPPKFIDEAANETYAILEKEQKQTTVKRFGSSLEMELKLSDIFADIRDTIFGTRTWREDNGMSAWPEYKKDLTEEEEAKAMKAGKQAARFVINHPFTRVVDEDGPAKPDKSEEFENQYFTATALSDQSQGREVIHNLSVDVLPGRRFAARRPEGWGDDEEGAATDAFSAVSDFTRIKLPLGVIQGPCYKTSRGDPGMAKTVKLAKSRRTCPYIIWRNPRRSPVVKPDNTAEGLFGTLKKQGLIKATRFAVTSKEMFNNGDGSVVQKLRREALKFGPSDAAGAVVLDMAESEAMQAKLALGFPEAAQKADFTDDSKLVEAHKETEDDMHKQLSDASESLFDTLTRDMKWLTAKKSSEYVFAGTVLSAHFAPVYSYFQGYKLLLGARETSVGGTTAREYAVKKYKMTASKKWRTPTPPAVPPLESFRSGEMERGNFAMLNELQNRFGPAAVSLRLEDLHLDNYFAVKDQKNTLFDAASYPKAVMDQTMLLKTVTTTYRDQPPPVENGKNKKNQVVDNSEYLLYTAPQTHKVVTVFSEHNACEIRPISALMPGLMKMYGNDPNLQELQNRVHYYKDKTLKKRWPEKAAPPVLPAPKKLPKIDEGEVKIP
eukprot:CAMPEP_0179008364 /NCGR_PEP_ID=MMETSP0795-20121207/15675_1 /TAXON_ID=88552 /ORGANISM="Amoebophrya sp., Strain Ameob2" /LENGTH=738 /DNA_ID=CAMNT_0020703441 /DNA_START=147 /DNA_END=2364 /DNA_ORIENTATION=-